MTTQTAQALPIELRALLMKATELDLDILDMYSGLSDRLSEVVQAKARNMIDMMCDRFNDMIAIVPEHLKKAATDFIYEYGEVLKDRRAGLAKRHVQTQRAFAYHRVANERRRERQIARTAA